MVVVPSRVSENGLERTFEAWPMRGGCPGSCECATVDEKAVEEGDDDTWVEPDKFLLDSGEVCRLFPDTARCRSALCFVCVL